MYKDWENLPAHAIGAQLARLVLMLGVYVLQATRTRASAPPATAILVGSVASTKEVAEYVHLLPGCKPRRRRHRGRGAAAAATNPTARRARAMSFRAETTT